MNYGHLFQSASRLVAPVFGSALTLCAGGAALAQTTTPKPPAQASAASTSSAPVLDDVVVQAQRRSENLQAVPVTVSAVTAQRLAEAGVNDLQTLSIAVPGLYIQNNDGYANPFLRGVGSSAIGPGIENPIAIYVDGVYYGASTGSLFSLNNIDQVEVLKGPQGTLFGRNATGGLIQITTRTPKADFSGDAQVSYGNYDTAKANLYVTGPIATDLAADLAVQYTHQGEGYGRDLTTGKQVYRTDGEFDLRSKWLFTPREGTRITFSADYENTRNSQLAFRLLSGTNAAPLTGPAYGGNTWDIQGTQPFDRTHGGGASLNIEQDFGFAKLQSITAYRISDLHKGLDLDSTAADFLTATVHEVDKEITQEVHFVSPTGSRLQWQAGVYYYYADGRYTPVAETLSTNPAENPLYPVGVAFLDTRQTTQSVAAFAQATTEILPRTNLTIGARYTYEHRHFDGDESADLIGGTPIGVLATADMRKEFTKPTFRVSLDHKLTDDIMVFASVNTGFKSGGFEPSVFTGDGFRPESIVAYEVGVKSDLLSHRLRLNASIFDYDYKQIQVQQVQAGAIGIVNGAGARVRGADVDVELRATQELTLTGGLEYLDARFTSFPDAPIGAVGGGVSVVQGSATDNRLPVAPTTTLNVGAHYKTEFRNGALLANVIYAYNSGYYAEPDNRIHQPAFSQVNASLKWEAPNGYDVTLWGENLTNEAYFTAAFTYQDGNQSAGYAPPRTYGVTLGHKF